MHLALASSQLPGAVRLCPRRPHVAPCVRPSALPSRRHHLTTLASSSRQQPPAAPATSPGNGWRTFWSTIDAGAWLGTVGTAVAFLLTQEALLVTGPVLLPLIALYASRQRGKLDAQAAQAEVQRQVTAALRQFASMSEESAIAIADEVAAAVDEVWQGLPAPEEALKKVEGKLKGLEGSVRSVEAAVASAKEDAAEQAGRTVREVSAALGALRRDLGGDLRKATGDELSALAGLDTRLAALEGALVGLEVAQAEGLRRLNTTMTSSLADNEDSLTAALRSEVWRSLEPVRQLPQLLAAASALPGMTESRLTEDAIRAIINEEVSAASRQVLEQQKALLEESAASPTTIAPAQWNQLGKRLINIDQQLGELKEAAQGSGEGALASEGDGALQQELEDLRSLFVQLSGAVKSALEQQQSMQSAVLTQASAQAAALTAVQASIEGALTQLCDELLAAVRSAAQSEAPSSTATPAWAEEMEMKITGALDPVMQALASTRTQTLEPQSTEAQGGLDLTNVSVKLDSLAGQLTELQRRVDQREASTTAQAVAAEGLAEAAAVIGPPDGLVEVDNTVTAATAGLDAKHDAYERMQSILQEESTAELEESADTAAVMGPPVEERIDEAAPMNAAAGGKNDAYERMQAMLREDSAIDADAAVSEGDLPETDFEFQNPEEQGGSAGPATGGVPISEWLSVDEPEASMEGGAAAMQLEDEEQDVVPIGETATSQGTSTSNAAGPRTEMVFNTFGGGGVEDPSLGQTPPTEQPSPQGGGSIPDSRADSEPSTPSNGASAPTSAVPNSTDTDAEELYTLGLENMRQGRALCAEPGGGGLTEGDALLADAYQCFQKTLAIDPGNIKALGNSGNALMARGRAALAMAEDAAARGQPEAAERLTQQAEQLLVKAGRLYREVLEGDASQARAFLNWGRVICLRAETARDRGNATGAHDLFCNAAEKFEAALELGMNGEQRAEGLRLAGSALMSGALCLGPEQGQARRELLGEAAEYLEAVVAGGQGPEVDEAWDKLQLCREYLSSR